MNPLFFLEYISFLRVRVVFEAIEPLVLPQYKGSAFRGCLGETLRAEVCTHGGLECEKCKERYSCLFSQLFNSYVDPNHPHQRKYSKSPHPFIIEAMPGIQTDFKSGETFGFDLTLIGKAGEYLNLLLCVFQRMGETGIGKGKNRFKPTSFQLLNEDLKYELLPYFAQTTNIPFVKLPIPIVQKNITFLLENPLRLKENGKLLLTPPSFDLLLDRLTLRLGLLAHFYCGSPWFEQEELSQFLPSGVQITAAEVKEVDWRRFSGTQDRTMNFDGLIGSVTYNGTGLNLWMPLIALGSWLHVGSTAAFGLGKYSFICD
jgi:hypothetical protein